MDLINTANHKFTVAADALHPNDNAESLNVGAEYVFMNLISLRGGYKSLFLDNTEEGLTLGFGLKWDFDPGLGMFVDYAYQDFGKLDYTQQFSLGVKF
jgi:opacity protein-like surface antigen